MSAVLHLPPDIFDALCKAARQGYPYEACGLLIGRREGSVHHVVAMRQARNLNRERAHDRYELDPADYLTAELAARDAGQEIVGIWHTHPNHPARPSETDRAAAWPNWSYLILSVEAGGVAAVTSWRLDGEAFVEEEMAS
ncbi:M67 family metallopeptidase [Crenobacter sp. SG2305]|uniref:M67 family metallopeptidase n=1 Tax=Crenobacter oryzisoli TaxID=3056844 RepID=UPI0025AAA2D1|nr:M67 family metallopeptidase [Crenobacter sp. SG2305]MDN0083574.1 M67 family metallopeptidase [Crenobacter sp. SG2305]